MRPVVGRRTGGAGGGVPGGALVAPSNALRTDWRLTPAAAGWTNAGSAATTETSPHGSAAATTSAGDAGPSPGRGAGHSSAVPRAPETVGGPGDRKSV